MKRWKCILKEYNSELYKLYKPGHANEVADALSRDVTKLNILDNLNDLSTATQHSAESSAENLIPGIETPINVFKNQIFLEIDESPSYQFKIVFPGIHQHLIVENEYNENKLLSPLKRYLNPSVINGIKTSENIMGKIQNLYPNHFSNYKCRFTQVVVNEIISDGDQEYITI